MSGTEGMDFDQPDDAADAIGDAALEYRDAIDQDEMNGRQIAKAAKTLAGRLHSLALERNIVPPEAIILDLTEDAEDAVREVLEAGLEANADFRKPPIHQSTADRIRRILDYEGTPEVAEAKELPTIVLSVPEADANMTLNEVTRRISDQDAVEDTIIALQRAHADMV